LGYKIDLGAWNGIFAVPCDLVDRQLRLAGAVQLKALLYILRHSGRAVELSEIAQVCAVSEADAADAVDYWRQEGIIVCDGQCLSPASQSVPDSSQDSACPSAPVPQPAVQPDAPAAVPAAAELSAAPVPKAKERIRYAYDECCKMISEDSELRQMMSVLGGIMCKTLNQTETSVFITLVKWYGLPPSCVAMLVEYCREIGKMSIAYIETTGVGWVNDEIVTVEQVDAKISRLRSARSAWGRVRSLLDIPERAPTKKEQEYVAAWINDWKFSDELILFAYEKCINNKGKLAMSYMNGILSGWHKKGITTVEQAQNDSAQAAPKASDSKNSGGMYSATYDKSDIEAMLDDDWMDDA